MAFSIGQKVVFKGFERRLNSSLRFASIVRPTVGQIYTIRAFCTCSPIDLPAILLEEIINNKIVIFAETNARGEPSFAARCFRPIQTTSIEELLSQRAPKDSAVWDNRKRAPARKKEKVS